MIHLDLAQAAMPCWGSPHVVMLRATQEKAGDMLSEALQRAFRTLCSWQRDTPPLSHHLADTSCGDPHAAHTSSHVHSSRSTSAVAHWGLVPGGGALELALASRLRYLAASAPPRGIGKAKVWEGGGTRGGGWGAGTVLEESGYYDSARHGGACDGDGEAGESGGWGQGGEGESEGERGVEEEGKMGEAERLVCRICADAFIAVPTALARNAALSASSDDTSAEVTLGAVKRSLLYNHAAAAAGASHELGAYGTHGVLMGVVSSSAPTPFRVDLQPCTACSNVQVRHGKAWWLGDVASLGILEPLAAKITVYEEFFHLLLRLVKLGDIVRVHRQVVAMHAVSGDAVVSAGKASDKGWGRRRAEATASSQSVSSGRDSTSSDEGEDGR
jgi:hypothetical protein